jgi:hypothetical protein
MRLILGIVIGGALTVGGAYVADTDADSRVDAYMCHETIKPVARTLFD